MSERAKNVLLLCAEALLVLIILGLIVLTWLPALIGAKPPQ